MLDIYGFSVGGTRSNTSLKLRDMSPYADYANVHAYAPDGIRPAWVLPAAVEGWSKIAPSDPVVMTETGYYTIPGHRGWGGVSENVQAQYLLDTAFGNASRGIARTYFYDLIDDGNDPNERENHFGMFRFDGSAKPVATAFHNLSTILADDSAAAASFATRPVSYSVQGLPFTGSSMLLEKADGTHLVAVWNEEDLWNEAQGTEIASAQFNVRVNLDRAYQTVLVFDPMLGSTPIAAYHDTSSVLVSCRFAPVAGAVQRRRGRRTGRAAPGSIARRRHARGVCGRRYLAG